MQKGAAVGYLSSNLIHIIIVQIIGEDHFGLLYRYPIVFVLIFSYLPHVELEYQPDASHIV
jgi:hypothetical protein